VKNEHDLRSADSRPSLWRLVLPASAWFAGAGPAIAPPAHADDSAPSGDTTVAVTTLEEMIVHARHRFPRG